MNDNYINNDDNNNSGGIRSRFNDRLNKINKNKRINNKNEDIDESVIKRGSRNIFKIILALPSVVYSVVKNKDNEISTNNELENNDLNRDTSILKSNLNVLTTNEEQEIKAVKVNEIKNINVSLIKERIEKDRQKHSNPTQKHNKDTNFTHCDEMKDTSIFYKANEQKVVSTSANENSRIFNSVGIGLNVGNITTNGLTYANSDEKELRIVKLQKEIIDLIKKKLVKNINELEVLQSELYLLNQLDMGDIYLKDCLDDIKEIKKLLSKVKALKEKYDFLKENIDFEYMLEYEDDLLVDKILELKTLCSSTDVKCVVDNYKILDEYKYLYLKIDKLQDDAIKYQDYKNDKVDELKQRDIDFHKLKNEVYDIDREKSRYDDFVKEQENFLEELNENVSKIDSRESVTYHFKGFNQLLGNSFKYLGLLLLNPFKGFMPSIATQSIITRNIINNLYKNLEWEEKKKMIYEAIDYSTAINNAINNLELTASMIDSTLDDIVRLKEKYNNEFAKYGSSISSYKDTIKKLNKIENAVLGSKIKVQSMQIKMKEKEKENSNKLKLIKKLNTSTNS